MPGWASSFSTVASFTILEEESIPARFRTDRPKSFTGSSLHSQQSRYHLPDVFDDIEREQGSRFSSGFCNDEIVKGVMVWNDQILFDEHQVVNCTRFQFVELLAQRIQTLLEELEKKSFVERGSWAGQRRRKYMVQTESQRH